MVDKEIGRRVAHAQVIQYVPELDSVFGAMKIKSSNPLRATIGCLTSCQEQGVGIWNLDIDFLVERHACILRTCLDFGAPAGR